MLIVLLLFFAVPTNASNDELAAYILLDENQRDHLQYSKRSPEEANLNQNYTFVGLGAHCQTAAQLNHYKYRNGAYPLDWLFSDSTDSIVQLLLNDFNYFFDEKYLAPNPNAPWRLENNYYKLEFRHEWHFPDTYMDEARYRSMLDDARPKYERRIERFKKLREYDGTVIFIRTASASDGDNFWEDDNNRFITRRQSYRLNNALRRFFPKLKFNLIIINYSDGKPDCSIKKLAPNLFELRVDSRNTFAYASFEHVFQFIKTLLPA